MLLFWKWFSTGKYPKTSETSCNVLPAQKPKFEEFVSNCIYIIHGWFIIVCILFSCSPALNLDFWEALAWYIPTMDSYFWMTSVHEIHLTSWRFGTKKSRGLWTKNILIYEISNLRMSWIVNSKLIKFQRTLYTIFLFEKSAIYLLCQNHIQHQDVSTHNHLQETSIPNFTTTRTSSFLEFQPFFPWIWYNYDLKNNIPKIYHLCFSHRFLCVSFFFPHQRPSPSLPCGCLWLVVCQEELQRGGEGGRGKYTRHLSFLYFYFLEKPMGKHSEKSPDFWTRFVFCFFSKHTFHFWKNGKHFVFPPDAYISSRKCGLKGLISPYCRPYFNGGWHGPKWRPVAWQALVARSIDPKKSGVWVAEFGSEVYLKIARKTIHLVVEFFFEGLIW